MLIGHMGYVNAMMQNETDAEVGCAIEDSDNVPAWKRKPEYVLLFTNPNRSDILRHYTLTLDILPQHQS